MSSCLTLKVVALVRLATTAHLYAAPGAGGAVGDDR
jgi:hypothetical protein